jgi:hypothetical protein
MWPADGMSSLVRKSTIVMERTKFWKNDMEGACSINHNVKMI